MDSVETLIKKLNLNGGKIAPKTAEILGLLNKKLNDSQEQAQKQACEGLAMAMDFTELQARVNQMEKEHLPFTYPQFRNILLIVWFIVISILSMVFYEQS